MQKLLYSCALGLLVSPALASVTLMGSADRDKVASRQAEIRRQQRVVHRFPQHFFERGRDLHLLGFLVEPLNVGDQVWICPLWRAEGFIGFVMPAPS